MFLWWTVSILAPSVVHILVQIKKGSPSRVELAVILAHLFCEAWLDIMYPKFSSAHLLIGREFTTPLVKEQGLAVASIFGSDQMHKHEGV